MKMLFHCITAVLILTAIAPKGQAVKIFLQKATHMLGDCTAYDCSWAEGKPYDLYCPLTYITQNGANQTALFLHFDPSTTAYAEVTETGGKTIKTHSHNYYEPNIVKFTIMDGTKLTGKSCGIIDQGNGHVATDAQKKVIAKLCNEADMKDVVNTKCP